MNYNKHLNIFRPFSQELTKENIEDNLSRAFVLCLLNNHLLKYEFLRAIFDKVESTSTFENLFASVIDLSKSHIDIQVNLKEVDDEFSTIIAVSMTGRDLDVSDFFSYEENNNKEHITDIFISINDVAIIIEVKRNNENCIQQLYQQATSLKSDKNEEDIKPLDFSWPKVMELVNRMNGFQKLFNSSDNYLENFIDLIKSHNPNWIPVSPLASIENTKDNIFKVRQRLSLALNNIKDEDINVLDYRDRIGLQIKTNWAKEIVIHTVIDQDGKIVLKFGIWPGNTKGQGTIMHRKLNKTKDWKPPTELKINQKVYKVEWAYELKFCHFNGFVNNIIVTDDDIKPGKNLITKHIHNKFTGKYDRKQWDKLDEFLSTTLVDSYDWKKELDWGKHFENTGRNYLTLSIGYQIQTIVHFDKIKDIDTVTDRSKKLSNFISKIKDEYLRLFD